MPKVAEKKDTVVVKRKTEVKRVQRRRAKANKKALEISRYYTERGKDPFASVEYEKRSFKTQSADGKIKFELNDVEVPKEWSKVASDIYISRYLRRNNVPQYDKYGTPIKNPDGSAKLGPERSIKQTISRLAGCWRWWGEKYHYFASKADAEAFEDELKYMLVNQIASPNSPQWFNTGLAYAYGITGKPQGHWFADPKTGRLKLSDDAYFRPQPHACFIQSVKDDLVNPGGIYDLVVREARIFKYGSGSGTNFSTLRARGEPISGGGASTGLMSWLGIYDKSAGAIKSGGITRRASKMDVLNIDHPDVEEFINWKYKEEQKAVALMATGYSGGLEGEAYSTVSGQTSNNSIRVTDDYMKSVEADGDWHLRWRTDPEHIARTIKAKELWKQMANAAWHCGDPGVQYDTTVNDWHTCLACGRINASNPCSEFMFLDDSSCNLASINLIKLYDDTANCFNVEAFRHAARLWTIVLEISVLMAQYPSYEIAKNSYLFRPLGLGYANLGALLMVMGFPYDSEEGKGMAAGITALMTGEAYSTSAEMAKYLGTFKMYEKNKSDMLRVIRNHRRAALNAKNTEFESLSVIPKKLNGNNCPEYILKAAQESWDKALLDGGRFGYRNAQVTLLAPTGTIGLAMDCDTTGVEPDYALVKFKKLIGGGYFKIINQSVPRALRNLGYAKSEIEAIIKYIIGTSTFDSAPHISRDFIKRETIDRLGLRSKNILSELGFSSEQIKEANEHICGVMTIEGAPELKDEHLAVFDCASKCGAAGKRYISPYGHVEMMAATQPFLSGAISKTVNLPSEVTVEDIEKIYFDSWKLGLKSIAIYRDGSKISQPLSGKDSKDSNGNVQKEVVIEYKPIRRRLPKERASITRKVVIAGHKIFLTIGCYDDGKPGEIFITMNQQGSFAAGITDSFAKMVSIGLQYGVPIETIVSQLRHMRFSPMGYTGDSDIPNVSSIPDFIAQWLDKRFIQNGQTIKLPFVEMDKERVKPQKIESQESAVLDNPTSSKERTVFEDLGFSGEMCPECGMATMVQNGKCLKCANCGATTGCS